MNTATAITAFLASAVEAIEMVAIVVGVGATRGWRSSLVGAGAGFFVLVIVGGGLGTTLTAVPIDALRLVVGTLLLIFGVQWLAKGIRRVAARGLAGSAEEAIPDEQGVEGPLGLDWLSFVISFKGVVLEGLEIAFIVVTFGAAANDMTAAAIGGSAALVVVAGLGVAFHRLLLRIPRSLLILVVGVLLSTFGTFWSVEGTGVEWPGGEAFLVVLLGLYAACGVLFTLLVRARALGLAPEGARA